MTDARNVFVQGALCGACAAVGLMFLAFWHMLTSSPDAGAMVDGQFRAYQSDPSSHILAVGGALLLAVGIAALMWNWLRLGRSAPSRR